VKLGTSRRLRAGALVGTAALGLATLSVGASDAAGVYGPEKDSNIQRHQRVGTAQLVKVNAPTRAARNAVVALGLDVTEAADARGIDVVLHGERDAAVLRRAGFTWTVKVADLAALTRANAARDRAYAKKMARSPLPSGRTTYRTLPDYNREMRLLASRYPNRVKLIQLRHRSILGRRILGIEVTREVRRVNDGKPVFLMLGAHHAREWPSSEHTMEFAYDLLQNDGRTARATRIMNRERTIFVPVVNVDGFAISRSAPPLGDFSPADNEMRRKNCRLSSRTPTAYRGGSCAANPAGAYRGTDLNRNYPGFWGGPGASADWSDATYRGDAPGREPESQNIRELISQRQVTALVTNHTYGNLVLRPPSTYETGLSPDEPRYRALGARMTDANGYDNQLGFQLYDTSGSTEDWSYWITGGLGFTFEIGTMGVHPAFQDAVVAEYLGRAPAAGAGRGGNREAYYRMADANLLPGYHSTIRGTAPKNRRLTVRKQFVSATAPVIVDDASPTVTTSPRWYRDVLTSTLVTRGGAFSWAVNPSTRPLVAGRSGRRPQAPAQPGIALTNPAGVPAVGQTESTTFEIKGMPTYDNGRALVTVGWPGTAGDEDLDWDVTILNAAGDVVGGSATLDDPEVATLIDPVPGVYTVEVTNYAGGTAASDWTGKVTFEQPRAPITSHIKEAWTLTCSMPNGRLIASRQVVVDRSRAVNVGHACSRRKG
jgi:hypothetical protein